MPSSNDKPSAARGITVGGDVVTFDATPLLLDSGERLSPFQIAYRTYGKLNAARSNVVWLCHTLTGDPYAAEDHPVTRRAGWWQNMIGPGKPFDTDKYFVICSNVLGGCAGSTGPTTQNPASKQPYGSDFPVITIADMVRAQKHLLDALKIEEIFCLVGGSMGGMQVLQWAASYSHCVDSAILIATTAYHSAQNIAFHEVGRQAIMADPNWQGGKYTSAKPPSKGLAVARMAAHITYLSESGLQRRFGRNLQDRSQVAYGFGADFQIESYLRHQGIAFTDRFDANSYLYITRAMDYFDLAADYGGVLAKAFMDTPPHFCVLSFSSDWLYPTAESRHIVQALHAANADVSFVEIETEKGHDAFLLDTPEMNSTITGFLTARAKARNL